MEMEAVLSEALYKKLADLVCRSRGRERAIDDETINRYSSYMAARWPRLEESVRHVVVGYAEEWLKRFIEHIEYEMSDVKGRAILDRLNAELNAVSVIEED